MSKQYDYIVIGGGSAGSGTANRAAMYGAKVLLIEGGQVGGTCVNLGCVPKKIMWYGAQVSETLHKYSSGYGFEVNNLNFDFTTLKANRDAYVQRSRQSYAANFERNGVEKIDGFARFIDNHTIEVNGQQYKAPHITIATGGHPLYPDIIGSELGETSDDFFGWETLPDSILIVGAGYIAAELAGVVNELGVETHLAFRKDHILRGFDDMVTSEVMAEMEKSGISLHANHVPKSLKRDEGGKLIFEAENGKTLVVDRVIWAIGRGPNVDMGLENTDIVLNDKGYIKADEFENTSVDGVYAIGEDNIKVYTSTFTSMYTAVTTNRQAVKMKLITLGKEEKVIGLHGVGYGIDEMIQGFSVAIKMGATKADFDDTVAIHPTGSEEFVTMR